MTTPRVPTLLFLLARELDEACKATPPAPSCSDPVTKGDLLMMEQRLLAAIGARGISAEDEVALDAALANLETIVVKLEQLNAQN